MIAYSGADIITEQRSPVGEDPGHRSPVIPSLPARPYVGLLIIAEHRWSAVPPPRWKTILCPTQLTRLASSPSGSVYLPSFRCELLSRQLCLAHPHPTRTRSRPSLISFRRLSITSVESLIPPPRDLLLPVRWPHFIGVLSVSTLIQFLLLRIALLFGVLAIMRLH